MTSGPLPPISELVLRMGDGAPVTLLVLPALFEEANRTRHLTVQVMRLLADRGIGTILPDLSGTGESLVALADTRLSDWLETVSAFAPLVTGSIAFRGGALLDGAITHRWRFAPDTGERLLRDLVRATSISSGRSVAEIDEEARTGPTRLAGNLVSSPLYTALLDAVPQGSAHVSTVTGPHLWRAAEPGSAPELAEDLADEIASWVAQCAAS